MSTHNVRSVLGVALAAGALMVLAALAVPPIGEGKVSQRPAASQQTGGGQGSSLEDAADRATATGRTVAIQLIGLGLAIAGIVLGIKRDFKEAVGVFAVGLLAVLMATPTGIELLRDTARAVFG